MFIQLRITPEFCGEPSLLQNKGLVTNELLEYFKKYGDVEYVAGVVEHLNKFGEETNVHWHINLVLDSHIADFRKDSFQAWFRRRNYLPKGNKCYSIAITADPDDENRWWRYLLKENSDTFVNNFPDDFKHEFDIQVAMAQDERKLQIERNVLARDRALLNDSFRLRCYNAINQYNEDVAPSDRTIFCDIMRYYMSNNKVPPFNTGMNMVIDFKCHMGYISIENYYDLRYNTENSFGYSIL